MGLLTDREEGGKKAPFPKIWHIYPAMMKLGTVIPCQRRKYLAQKIKRNTPWNLLKSVIFHQKSANFIILQNADIDCILVHNFYFLLSESLKIVLINMITTLMMSAKMAILGLLKLKVLWGKVMTSCRLSMTSPRKFYRMT